jgi:hypothetical protein
MSATIVVILGEPEWTQRALHLAAALAREWRAAVTLVKLLPVAHLEYLGAGVGETLLPYQDICHLEACTATVESYGVPTDVRLFQYSDFVGAVLSAAELFGAAAMFAPAPASRLPGLARLQVWWLRRGLGVPLYTLDAGDAPLVLALPATAEAGAAGSQPSPALR